MADVKFRVGRTALVTGVTGQQQSFTIPGFGTPTAAIFIVTEASVNNTTTDGAFVSVGWCNATQQHAAAAIATDLVDPTQAASTRVDYASILRITDEPAVSFHFEFVSFSTDTVTLELTGGNGTAYLCTFILIGGADVTNTYIGSSSIGASAGTTDITAIGFEPDLAFFTSISESASAGVDYHLNFGMWVNDGSNSQKCYALTTTDNAASTAVGAIVSNNSVYKDVSESGTVAATATISTPDASGFSIVSTGTPASILLDYFALKFANSPGVALVDVTFAVGSDYSDATIGFQPDFGVLVASRGPTTFNTGISTNTSLSLAAFDASNIFTSAQRLEDARGVSDFKSYAVDNLVVHNNGTDVFIVEASSYSFDVLGWSFPLSTKPGVAVPGFALAIGPTNVPAIHHVETAPITANAVAATTDGTISYVDTANVTAVAAPATIDAYGPPGTGASVLPSITLSGIMAHGVLAFGEVSLPSFTLSGVDGDSAEVSIPLLTCAGTGTFEPYGAVTFPLPTQTGISLQSYPANGNTELTLLEIAGQAISGVLGVGVAEFPAFTFTAVGGSTAGATLPVLSLQATGIVGLTARGNNLLPKLVADAAGASQARTVGASILPSFSLNGAAIRGAVATGEDIIAIPTLFALGAAGNAQAGEVTFSRFMLAGSGFADITATGEVTFPVLTSYGVGTASVSSFLGWVLNPESGRVSNYTSFPFLALGKIGNQPAGATADGIYLLSGGTDDGQAIASVLQFGMAEFGNQALAHARDVYVSGSIDGDMELSIQEDGSDQVYAHTLSKRDKHIQGHRAKLGKGYKARFRQVTISNVSGNDFAINGISFPSRALNKGIDE